MFLSFRCSKVSVSKYRQTQIIGVLYSCHYFFYLYGSTIAGVYSLNLLEIHSINPRKFWKKRTILRYFWWPSTQTKIHKTFRAVLSYLQMRLVLSISIMLYIILLWHRKICNKILDSSYKLKYIIVVFHFQMFLLLAQFSVIQWIWFIIYNHHWFKPIRFQFIAADLPALWYNMSH